MIQCADKEWVIFGAGWCGQQFYYQCEEKNRITCIVDNYAKGKFHGFDIVSIHEMASFEGIFVWVTVSESAYKEICEQLTKLGLQEFIDFAWWNFYNKSLVVIYSNCYGEAYRKYLQKSREFMDRYAIYIIRLHELDGSLLPSQKKALAFCDLLIIQDLRSGGKLGEELSADHIMTLIPDKCKVVVVPNLVGYGAPFFPKIFMGGMKKREEGRKFASRNYIIDNGYKNGKTVTEIAEEMKREDLLDEIQIQSLIEELEHKKKKFRNREKKWDVKICDFIEENYRIMKLFTDRDHVTPILMNEICHRLGHYLGLHDADRIENSVIHECIEGFVFPSVKKALGLQWKEDHVRCHAPDLYSLSGKPMDLEEYVKQYIFWMFDGEEMIDHEYRRE